ncbi:RHO1 GDP-GTP exchange protein 2 [Conoideocrella luteorostrata]|uniref:RHO1 GDP-GTP exchange protein 2 n=1 Tax=Conoideocrella luteorostrata TaxID=1105319 RepID=A0AAJ0CS88_9HYPO|nr:RHO1 GDP-GTP exchange protein 2 [Conoideocrella luteorostrata]
MADSDARQAATRILAATDVKQIAVLEVFQLLVVLARGNLQVYAISAIPSSPPTFQMLQTIQIDCNTFIEGRSMGKHLICCLKTSMSSSTVKVLEVEASRVKATDSQSCIEPPATSAIDLKLWKEFYIPYKSSEMSLTESGLCIASKNGLDLVALDTLELKPFRY